MNLIMSEVEETVTLVDEAGGLQVSVRETPSLRI